MCFDVLSRAGEICNNQLLGSLRSLRKPVLPPKGNRSTHSNHVGGWREEQLKTIRMLQYRTALPSSE